MYAGSLGGGTDGEYNKRMSALRREIEQLCNDYDVQTLYVFGSRAGEIQKLVAGSAVSATASQNDVDIAVLSASPFSLDQKVRFALALEEILAAPRVDLVMLTEADPFLAANAIRGNRLYARDAYQADEFELFVLRRAGDLAPFERERMSLILQEG